MIDSTVNNFNTIKKYKKNNKLADTSGKILYVKYMVCLRDKVVLQSTLDKMEINYIITAQGAIHFLDEITTVQYEELKKSLKKFGLILLSENESQIINRIINTIVQVIHYTDELPKLKFSDLLSEYAGEQSMSIMKIFSDVKGMSILQFIIIQKIERAKEMLLYEDMPLEEMADILNYKNEDYLIAQIKKVTGLSPHEFKRLKKEREEIAKQHFSNQDPEKTKTSS